MWHTKAPWHTFHPVLHWDKENLKDFPLKQEKRFRFRVQVFENKAFQRSQAFKMYSTGSSIFLERWKWIKRINFPSRYWNQTKLVSFHGNLIIKSLFVLLADQKPLGELKLFALCVTINWRLAGSSIDGSIDQEPWYLNYIKHQQLPASCLLHLQPPMTHLKFLTFLLPTNIATQLDICLSFSKRRHYKYLL